ncbi:hypothetical protein MEQU1_002071 [Malassezia equina]|uniref:Carboxylesterase type B domain-containing protein n=1 Tax=Malassezia equina TaxID=1381935 RepID=A0AAF0EBM4_9BASI|nr:hypothetical protein MEQU1_002071 [Malassezia equina]
MWATRGSCFTVAFAIIAVVASHVLASNLHGEHRGMARRYQSKLHAHESTIESDSEPAKIAHWSSSEPEHKNKAHLPPNSGKWDEYLVVDVEGGKVRGTYNKTAGAYKWLGVPFGDDTGGSNRFMPPKPAPKWNGIKDASDFAKSCPQHGSGQSVKAISLFGLSPDIFKEELQSEDCLTADIYVGKKHWNNWVKTGGEAKKAPVWLNLYGGSYEWGSSRIETYRADPLVAEEDIIVVNINFRNWIFGNPLSPQLYPTKNKGNPHYKGANPGLNDVDLGIEWVYKNIEKFGGDPEKISMGGTSTGACTSDNWAFAHYQKESSKYINGLILQSGSMTSLGRSFLSEPGDDFTSKHSAWNNVSRVVGCGTDNDEAQFKCMQNKRWQDIMNATFTVNANFILTVDNITAFADYEERLQQKRVVDVPMLIGNNKDEGNAMLIHAAYLTDIVGPIITAEIWVCPASVESRERMALSSPTWRYRFSPAFYIPDMPKSYQQLLTFHGSDTPYAWDTWRPLKYISDGNKDPNPLPFVNFPIPTSDNDVRAPIAKNYKDAMVTFVKDPHKGLYNFRGGWPRYDPNTRSIADIGYNNKPDWRLASSWEVDGLCPLTNPEVKQNVKKWTPLVMKFRGFMV